MGRFSLRRDRIKTRRLAATQLLLFSTWAWRHLDHCPFLEMRGRVGRVALEASAQVFREDPLPPVIQTLGNRYLANYDSGHAAKSR